MDAFAIARLVIGAAFLGVGAASDLRSRRVRDPLWVALGSIGLVLLAVEIGLSYWWVNDWLYLITAAILFYLVFYGEPLFDEDGFHVRPTRLFLLGSAAATFVAAVLLPNPYAFEFLPAFAVVIPDLALAAVPVMILVYQAFYQAGLLRGGADTKALIALTLLVPLYPDVSPFPLVQAPPAVTDAMRAFFPFSLVVLVDAAVLVLVVPLAYLVVNVARREFEWPVGLLGTRVPIDAIPPHAWVMERVGPKGERYAVLFPSRKADESQIVAKLRAVGATKVWVERKIPFIVLLFVGYVLAFFVGNLILGFLVAVLPGP